MAATPGRATPLFDVRWPENHVEAEIHHLDEREKEPHHGRETGGNSRGSLNKTGTTPPSSLAGVGLGSRCSVTRVPEPCVPFTISTEAMKSISPARNCLDESRIVGGVAESLAQLVHPQYSSCVVIHNVSASQSRCRALRASPLLLNDREAEEEPRAAVPEGAAGSFRPCAALRLLSAHRFEAEETILIRSFRHGHGLQENCSLSSDVRR